LLQLAAEVLLDLFRAFLRFVRGVSSACAGIEHLGQSLGNHELPGNGGRQLALPLWDAPPLEVPRAANDRIENLDRIDLGQQFLLVYAGAELDPAIGIFLRISRKPAAAVGSLDAWLRSPVAVL
jgi:hypothetical protein